MKIAIIILVPIDVLYVNHFNVFIVFILQRIKFCK